jgi:hypothetical protein
MMWNLTIAQNNSKQHVFCLHNTNAEQFKTTRDVVFNSDTEQFWTTRDVVHNKGSEQFQTTRVRLYNNGQKQVYKNFDVVK